MLSKICGWIDYPFLIIRKLTMPPCNENEYEKWWCIVWPIPGFIFSAYVLGMLN